MDKKNYISLILFRILILIICTLGALNVSAQCNANIGAGYPDCGVNQCINYDCPNPCGGPGEPDCPKKSEYNILLNNMGAGSGKFIGTKVGDKIEDSNSYTDTPVDPSDPRKGFLRIYITDKSALKCGYPRLLNDNIELRYKSYYRATDPLDPFNPDRQHRQCSGGITSGEASFTKGGAIELKFSRRPEKIYMRATSTTEIKPIRIQSRFDPAYEAYLRPTWENGPDRTSFIDNVNGRVSNPKIQAFEFAWDQVVSDKVVMSIQGIADAIDFGLRDDIVINDAGDREAQIQIREMGFEIDINRFDFTTDPVTETVAGGYVYTGAPPIVTPLAVPGELEVGIRDVDNGRLVFDESVTEARDFFYKPNNNFINEVIPLPNTIRKQFPVEFRPRFNGPAEQVFIIDSDQANNAPKQFTFKIENSRSPGYVWKGMDIWLKGDFGVTRSGNNLEKWRDFTASEHNFGQTVVANQPQIVDDAVNFLPAMRFSGNEFLEFVDGNKSSYASTDKDEVTWYGVFIPDTDMAGAVWGISDGVGSDRQLISSTVNFNAIGGTSSRFENNVPNLFKAGVPQVIAISYKEGQPDESRIRINGLDIGFFTAKSVNETVNDLQIGADGNSDNLFNGLIPEMIFYRDFVPAADKPRVDSYFAIRYGITLKTPYVNSRGQEIYSQSSLNTYGNDIVGLSIDKRSELMHVKSVSANDGGIIIETNPTQGITDPVLLAALDNRQFIMGHDGNPMELTADNSPAEIARTKRTWFVQNTNEMVDFKVTVNFDGIPGVTNFDPAVLDTFKLLIDDGDGVFSDGVIIDANPTAVENQDGDSWIEFDVPSIPNNSTVSPAIEGTFVEGTAFTNYSGGVVSKGREVQLLRNGNLLTTTEINSDGSFLFIIQALTPSVDDNFLAFLDHPTDKGMVAFSLEQEKQTYSNADIYLNELSIYSPFEPDITMDNLIATNARIQDALGNVALPDRVNATKYLSFDASGNMTLSESVATDPDSRDFGMNILRFSRYRPGANLKLARDLRINGYLDAGDNELRIGRNWRLNDLTGMFIGAVPNPIAGMPPVVGSTVIFEKRTNKVFGSNTFWNFEKITTEQSVSLFFEKNKTTTILNRIIIDGDPTGPLRVLSMEVTNQFPDGNESPGEQAILNTMAIPFDATQAMPTATMGYKFAKDVRVRDNKHIGQSIIDPLDSTDEGNTIDWFDPTVTFESIESIDDENKTNPYHLVAVKLSSKSSKQVTARITVDIPSTIVPPAVDPYGNNNAQTGGADPADDYVQFFYSRDAVTALNTGTPPTPIGAGSLTTNQIEMTFLANEDILYLVFQINDDDIFEGDEILRMSINSRPNAATGEDDLIDNGILGDIPEHVYILFDNEGLPSISMDIDAPNIAEEGETTANVNFTLTGKTAVDATITFSYGGVAEHTKDYELQATNNSLTIPAGTNTASLVVKAKEDLIREDTEDVLIDIETAVNVQELGQQEIFFDVLDNELPPEVTIRVEPTSIFENFQEAFVFITIEEDTQLPIEVEINDIGSASIGTDYRIDGKDLRIEPGQRISNKIKVLSVEDDEAEFVEEVNFTFKDITEGRIGNESGATLVINDNDPSEFKSILTVDRERILGDGRGTSNVTLQLRTIDDVDINQSAGVVTMVSSRGTLGPVVDNMDGTYTAVLTSEVATITSIVASISAQINGLDVIGDVTVIFEVALDSDNDNIYDFCECPNPPNCEDTDRDGIFNYLDVDSDNDGIEDGEECLGLTGNCVCDDSDGDTIPDIFESNVDDFDQDGLSNAADTDSDNDGKLDNMECMINGNCPDSDGDGILDPFDADDNTVDPDGGDSDNDGIKDKVECPKGGICPDADLDNIPDYFDDDSNNNGINDMEECPNGVCPDCDGDGVNNLLDEDDDNNGIADVDELTLFTKDTDTDGDGVLNICDEDDDGDGIRDDDECLDGFPCPDTDGDGVPDYLEIDNDGDNVFPECLSPPNCADRDGDGIQDQNDMDADGDSIFDVEECEGAVDGVCPDTDGDGTPNNLDLDSNGNGIPDRVEANTDCDNDGIKSYLDLDEKCPETIPKVGVFSPNYDGVNDYWYIENINRFPENKVTVYNRFGAVVFEMQDYDNEDIKKRWNGFQKRIISNRKEIMPTGTYFFMIELDEDSRQTGYVMIVK